MKFSKSSSSNNSSKSVSDMTKGSILKNLVVFALPVFGGNVFQQIYNIADTAIVGNILGENALAAVGAAAPIYGLILGFANGLTNGFSVITARFFGAHDESRTKKAVSLTYALTFILSVVLTAITLIFATPVVKLLGTPKDIAGDTEAYIKIIAACSIIMMVYNMLAGMLRAFGNSKAPLYCLIAGTAINIVLDILFTGPLKMGVPGAAWATVIAQMGATILCFIYIAKKMPFLLFRKKDLSFDKNMISELMSMGLSMAFMLAIVSIGTVILQSAVNSFGTATITAHTAARKIDEVFMIALSTVAMAASTFISQNYGAGKLDRVRSGIKCALIIAFIWSAFSIIIVFIFGRTAVGLLTGSSDKYILDTASMYIRINILFYPVLSVLLVLRNSLQGLGRKLVPVSASVVELVLKIAAVFVFAPLMGYFGICILEPVIWFVCAVMVFTDFCFYFRKNKNNKNINFVSAN